MRRKHFTILFTACATACLVGCEGLGFDALRPSSQTVVLFFTGNVNSNCIGISKGLCGPDSKAIAQSFTGIFASESECAGLGLRPLAPDEHNKPQNQIPLSLSVQYLGHRRDTYMGTGENEDTGWSFGLVGPNGYISAETTTEAEMVRRVCVAAKGKDGFVQGTNQ